MDGTEKFSGNDRRKQRKRKTNEMSPNESRTTSDTKKINGNKDIVRPKLMANKRFKPTEILDTPQMADIKMKLQQRKAKLTQAIVTPQNFSQNPTASIIDFSKGSCDGAGATKPEFRTPQMRIIYEKIQKKNINKKVSKQLQSIQSIKEVEIVDNIKQIAKIDRKKKKRREGVTESWGSNHESSNTSSSDGRDFTGSGSRSPSIKDIVEIKSDKSSFTKNVLQNKNKPQYKCEETITENKQYNYDGNKKGGILTKNLARDRMEKLRKTLRQQIKDSKGNKSTQNNDKTLIAIIKDNKVPDIYEASDIRYKNLRNRLLCKKAISQEDRLMATVKNNMQNNQSLNMSSVNPVESNDSSFCEEMDWEPMEDEKITFEVQAARIQLCVESDMSGAFPMESNFLQIPTIPMQGEKITLYIVVDTNVFLSNLDGIVKAMLTEFARYDKPIIVVPWNVIRELDYLKEDKFERKTACLREKARRAINFLNDHFSIKHPRIVGQTLEDARRNREQYATECPDDEILQTCLQIRNSGRAVALISYDKNLCNKAMIYDVMSLGRDDTLDKIDYILGSNSKDFFLRNMSFETAQGGSLQMLSAFDDELRRTNKLYDEIQSVVKEFLTVIVSKEMKNLFGEPWQNHTIVRPPWTILCVLRCALKHWIAAISEAFDRQAEPILKEFLEIFTVKPKGGRTLRDVSNLLDKCHDLTQMMNIEKYSELSSRASSSIENIKRKCQNDENELRQRWIQEEIGLEDDAIEQKRRADRAFDYFNHIYTYSRAIGGMAADIVNMTCNFCYEVPNPAPTVEYVKKVQPEIGLGVNRLLRILSKALDGIKYSTIDHKTLIDLYHLLTNFLPDRVVTFSTDLCPLDVHCCLKEKEDILRTGVKQLQELGAHYSRLASYRCI